MGRLVLIAALSAAVLLSLWYFLFARYNREKGARALRWVEAACTAKGEILEARWSGVCRLQARLRFAAHWFENARVTVHLRPRPIPLKWLVSVRAQKPETPALEADPE